MPLITFAAAISMLAQTPASTPEQTVQTFASCLTQKDFKGAAACVQGGTVPDFMVADVSRQDSWLKFTLSKVMATTVGSRAIVDFHLKTEQGSESEERDGYLVLVQSNGSWLIDGHGGETLSGMANLFVNSSTAAQAHKAATSAVCLSNVKQISLGIIMFTNDSDDKLALSSSNWITKILPYVKTKNLFYCPEDTSGNVSYSFNDYLAGKTTTSLSSPATTVMVYEGKGGQLTFRHGGRAAVGFADGHAKLLGAADTKLLQWKP